MGLFDFVAPMFSGVGDFVSDLTGSGEAADKAIAAQTRYVDEANKLAAETRDIQRADVAPWREAGQRGLSSLEQGMPEATRSFTMGDFQQDPAYQFRFDEGMKALERSAAARGGLNSGATLKALTRFGQDYASQEYDKAYNRFTSEQDRRYNKYASLAGVGQVASQNQAQYAGQYGQTVGGNLVGLGNAQAAAHIGAANMNAQLLGGLAQGGGTAAAAFSDERLKKNIKPVNKEDLEELRNTIKPYVFEYIDGKFGDGEFIGVMAQDLEKTKLGKNLVKENSDGYKYIDLNRFMSLVIATYAEVR